MAGYDFSDFDDAPKKDDYDFSDFDEKVAPSKQGELSSALKGAEQGLTFGFADEIGGGIQAGMDKLAGLFGNSIADKNKALADQGFKGDIGPTDSSGFYKQARDENRDIYKQAQDDNPASYMGGELGGGLLGMAVPGLGATSLPALASQGAAYGLGASESEDLSGLAQDTATGGAFGLGAGALAKGLEKGVTKGAEWLSPKVSNYLKDLAEKSALNATGATGKQVSNFSDDAGRQLLDRKIVRFGDSQSKIASRASQAVEFANSQIDDALKALEAKGVKVDANDIYDSVANKIKGMKGDPSQADIAKILDKELDNLLEASISKGSPEFGVLEAERIKRGYNRKAGNWADPEKSMAGKEMYQQFRGGVEAAAEKADPSLSKLFKEGKESYGLLAPIEEAASRRAATTQQSPAGGLLDMAAGGAGMVAGGPLGGAATAIARRVISPRITSSVAVGADKLSDIIAKSPQTLGKFAPAFQKAATRGGNAVGITDFLLQSNDPEYREMKKGMFGEE